MLALRAGIKRAMSLLRSQVGGLRKDEASGRFSHVLSSFQQTIKLLILYTNIFVGQHDRGSVGSLVN